MRKIASEDPIGVFDSGVGGLTVLKAVRELLPAENLVYVADTAYVPYGGRSVEVIESRVVAIADFLVRQRAKLLVVACNTATATGVGVLRARHTVPVVGLEPALKPAVELGEHQRVGVLATAATLESEKYRTLRARFDDRATIIERAAPCLVDLVESAPKIGPSEMRIVTTELQPLIDAEVDSVVLGCTHFPFLTEVIQAIMGPGVRLFESGAPVAREVRRRLGEQLNPGPTRGEISYYSSDPARARTTFELLLGRPVELGRVD